MFIHEEKCKVDGYHGKVEAVSDQHVTDVIVDNLSDGNTGIGYISQ